MNKTTEYIDALLLSERESGIAENDIRAVHQALDAEHRTYSRRRFTAGFRKSPP